MYAKITKPILFWQVVCTRHAFVRYFHADKILVAKAIDFSQIKSKRLRLTIVVVIKTCLAVIKAMFS